MKPISFIIPSRNNLRYLKWCYNSIRKNLGYYHEICIADDASEDGTWEWLEKQSKIDIGLKIHRNEGPDRQGLVVLYDKLITEYATNDIVMIFHADMYAVPGLDEAVFKHIKKGTLVTATRVEPTLHPPGPEKITSDYGVEPEDFDEAKFLKDTEDFKEDKITHGIFAPWAIYKDDFLAVGGHDTLFSPTSREDSDIFNRFILNGYKFVQTWEGLVYHLTSRGSRFNTFSGGAVGQDSDEWKYTNYKNIRNFIRKWGSLVNHDEHMLPIVSPKYDIGLVINNCNLNMLQVFEPWGSTIYVNDKINSMESLIDKYIEIEQSNTTIDLKSKLKDINDEKTSDIIIEFDGDLMTDEKFQFLIQLPLIIEDSGKIGDLEHDIFKVTINSMKRYEKENIICTNNMVN